MERDDPDARAAHKVRVDEEDDIEQEDAQRCCSNWKIYLVAAVITAVVVAIGAGVGVYISKVRAFNTQGVGRRARGGPTACNGSCNLLCAPPPQRPSSSPAGAGSTTDAGFNVTVINGTRLRLMPARSSRIAESFAANQTRGPRGAADGARDRFPCRTALTCSSSPAAGVGAFYRWAQDVENLDTGVISDFLDRALASDVVQDVANLLGLDMQVLKDLQPRLLAYWQIVAPELVAVIRCACRRPASPACCQQGSARVDTCSAQQIMRLSIASAEIAPREALASTAS